MTGGRLALAAIAAAVAFVIGFYVGFFVLLSIVDLEGFEGWQFELATVPTGGLFAGLATAAAVPSTRRVWGQLVGAGLAAAAVAVAALNLLDGDFGVAIGLGGLLVVGATTVTAAISTRARDHSSG